MSQPEDATEEVHRPSLSSIQRAHDPLSGYSDKRFQRYHQYSTSDSTAASASNDSSPTTTVSTVDDSSATETSPGSSPESPPPSTFAARMLRPRTSDDSRGSFFELQKQPPSRKGRNLKNLAVRTSQHPRGASTTSLPVQPSSQLAPADEDNPLASPTFVKPASPPRRKPSNLGLTLQTPGNNKLPFREIKLTIPPSPAFGRPGMLRHFQSSPSLPLFPGLDSQTGIGFHGLRGRDPAQLETILSPIEPLTHVQVREEEEPNYDIPLSMEEKPEAYPQGPICIYESGIDLYLEPSAEQCREYDVVMNVASEVRNPLVKDIEPVIAEPELRIDGGGGIQYAPRHLHRQLRSGGDEALAAEASPTTPKATPLNQAFPAEATSVSLNKDPEYVHVPWEHNSDIVPDLLRLVKMMDEKVKQRKRVLVHCQCGVSRSASLVVAYGLYKDPTMSVQEAYDAVKKRSRWIGPNMNLIMQLQEFRTSLTRGGLLPGNRGFTPITPSSAFSEWQEPLSASPSDSMLHDWSTSAGLKASSQVLGRESATVVIPGPSSAPHPMHSLISEQPPPGLARSTQRPRATSAVTSTSAYVDPSGHVVPVLMVVAPSVPDETEKTHAMLYADHESRGLATPIEPVASPRSEEFAMTPLQPPKEVDPADRFGLMSPTSAGFQLLPFDRSALLASLGMDFVQSHGAPRRALSLRSGVNFTACGAPTSALTPSSAQRPRSKRSSPDLCERQQDPNLLAKHELAATHINVPTHTSFSCLDEALMSPRATEFTRNPFAVSLTVQDEPAANVTTRSPDADPRSPAQTGMSPITRSILDVL